MKLQLKPHIFEGRLITFCGLDGCGKTTLIKLLKQYFAEFDTDIFLTKQPTDDVRNSDIFRTYMDNPDHSGYDYRSLSLFAASDRIQHTNNCIIPMLRKGITVISDRYFYSCLANLRARGYTEDNWIYEISSHIVKPDISIFLDVDVDLAIQRVRTRSSEKYRYIDIELQYKLKEEYINIANDIGGVIINTNRDIESSFYELQTHLSKVLHNV